MIMIIGWMYEWGVIGYEEIVVCGLYIHIFFISMDELFFVNCLIVFFVFAVFLFGNLSLPFSCLLSLKPWTFNSGPIN